MCHRLLCLPRIVARASPEGVPLRPESTRWKRYGHAGSGSHPCSRSSVIPRQVLRLCQEAASDGEWEALSRRLAEQDADALFAQIIDSLDPTTLPKDPNHRNESHKQRVAGLVQGLTNLLSVFTAVAHGDSLGSARTFGLRFFAATLEHWQAIVRSMIYLLARGSPFGYMDRTARLCCELTYRVTTLEGSEEDVYRDEIAANSFTIDLVHSLLCTVQSPTLLYFDTPASFERSVLRNYFDHPTRADAIRSRLKSGSRRGRRCVVMVLVDRVPEAVAQVADRQTLCSALITVHDTIHGATVYVEDRYLWKVFSRHGFLAVYASAVHTIIKKAEHCDVADLPIWRLLGSCVYHLLRCGVALSPDPVPALAQLISNGLLSSATTCMLKISDQDSDSVARSLRSVIPFLYYSNPLKAAMTIDPWLRPFSSSAKAAMVQADIVRVLHSGEAAFLRRPPIPVNMCSSIGVGLPSFSTRLRTVLIST